MCLRCPPGPILGAVPAFPVSAIPVLGQLEKEEKEKEKEEKEEEEKEEEEEEEYGRAGPGRRAGPMVRAELHIWTAPQQCPPNTLPENCFFTTCHPPFEGTTTTSRPCLAS